MRRTTDTGKYNRAQSGRGYVLLQSLIAIAGLLALMAMLSTDTQSFTGVVQNHLRLRRADAAAEAAVNRAMASIANATPADVTLNDDWALQGANGNEEFQFQDRSADYRMEIVDLGSAINLNTATAAQLEELPLTQSQVDSLEDWIEPGETARDDGAKDAYYNGLTPPYNAKLAPLTTLDEVLEVQGWTPATIYQVPTNTTTLTLPTDQSGNTMPIANFLTAQNSAPNVSATGGALINLNNRAGATTAMQLQALGLSRQSAAAIAARMPLASFAAMGAVNGLSRQDWVNLLNNVTFSTATTVSGKYNLNTVSSTVLSTLPNVSTAEASAITQQQSSGYTQLGDLANVSGLSTGQLSQIADYFTVGSSEWMVHAYGESGGVGESLEAIVANKSGVVSLVSLQRIATGQPPLWWGWSTQTPTIQDSEESQ